MQIDCSLDWKEQINAVATKVSRAIGFLRHAESFLPRASLKTLYTGIVEPHFRYCCSVWGCTGSTDINQLQKLQNRAARIITNSNFGTPSRPLIAELGWKTIEELIGNETKTMVFKSLNDLAPQYLCNLFTKNSACSSRSLRNTEADLRLLKKSSANGKKFFLSGELNYGIAFLLSLSRHPPWVVSKNQYRVDYFLFFGGPLEKQLLLKGNPP